jgi:hypothetical protein
MYLYLDVHGLIFETSVWLLAESTRLLPFSFKHGLPQTTNSRATVQKLTRDLHLWTTRHYWTVSVLCDITCMSSNFSNNFCLQEIWLTSSVWSYKGFHIAHKSHPPKTTSRELSIKTRGLFWHTELTCNFLQRRFCKQKHTTIGWLSSAVTTSQESLQRQSTKGLTLLFASRPLVQFERSYHLKHNHIQYTSNKHKRN